MAKGLKKEWRDTRDLIDILVNLRINILLEEDDKHALGQKRDEITTRLGVRKSMQIAEVARKKAISIKSN